MVRRAHPSDLLCLHLAVAGFGFAGVFGKLLALSPVMIVAGRTGFAALTLGILVSLRPSLRGVATPGSGWWLIPPGVLLAVHWWMFFEAVQTSTVAVALVSFSTFPVLVILWDACMSRRAPTLLDLVAVVVAFLGVGLIVPRFDLSEFVFRGVLWGLGSGATFAMILLWNRWRVMDGSPIWLAMIQNAVAFAVLLPTVAAEWVLPSVREWMILACLGMVFTGGTHSLFIRSLRSVPAKLASLVCTMEPAYGIVAAVLVLSDVPTLRTLLGASIVVGAVILVTVRKRPE